MTVVIAICAGVLVAAAALCIAQALRSEGVVDRAVALVLGLLGFLTTATVARYLGRDR